jgi:hypothetical protein
VLRRFSAVALALVCASPALPTAATSVPTFLDMPWGATQAQVQEAARTAGLTVVSIGPGDVELSGEPFGVPAVVHARISPDAGLVKVEVRFTATDTPAQTYTTVKERLTAIYGPTDPVELFKRPFVRGDGRENEAVLTGKAVLIAAWGDEREPGQAAVIVQAIRPGVLLDFESHGWKAEAVRRERQSPTQRRAPAGPPQLAD